MSDDPLTSVEKVAESEEKIKLLKYANLFLLSEIKKKMELLGM
jgi:hypothetical protein